MSAVDIELSRTTECWGRNGPVNAQGISVLYSTTQNSVGIRIITRRRTTSSSLRLDIPIEDLRRVVELLQNFENLLKNRRQPL
jgi:hypothetical protein